MSLFDLSFVVAALSNQTATVQRPTLNGYDANGRALARTWATIATGLKIPFQPIAVDLNRNPEGFSDVARFNVWSPIELFNLDRLTVGGRFYEVERANPWNTAGNYCQAVVKELDVSEAPGN